MSKDSEFDRLIINPTGVNSRMLPYSNYTRRLAPGCLLALLSLRSDESFRFCADDLSDFYYTFQVPLSRARRNAVGVVLQTHEVCGLRAYSPALEGVPVFACLATLAMGDGHAVEIAQGSHHALLQLEAGSMRDHEVLEYRKPVPRSDFIELLAIDDRIGVQRVPTAVLSSQPELRDSLVFREANAAYERVGLKSHPKKRRRNETVGTLLGADFDGVVGRVCAPRGRVHLLCLITAVICAKGTCTPKLLSCLIGCWIHVVMFRRPLLSLMDAVFHEGKGVSPTSTFCMTRQAISELMTLCLLAPCAQADLRAGYCPEIFALDASPSGGGVVAAKSTPEATRELWRHTEQRGCYTTLLPPASATLRELGLSNDVEELFAPLSSQEVSASCVTQPSVPATLHEGYLYDCLELFSGSEHWSKCHTQQGLSVHNGIYVQGGRLRFADISEQHVARQVAALILRRVAREIHVGPPSPSFGALR